MSNVTKRPSFDEYIMQIAYVVATRATCDRKHVGAVIVKDKHILSTGYNGSLPGQPHCDDAGHLMEHDHCIRTVHAEANAILYASRHGVELRGSSIYTTASPCWNCFPLIVQAGIKEIVFAEVYRDSRVFDSAEASHIAIRRASNECIVRGHAYPERKEEEDNVVQRCSLCGTKPDYEY